jgi:hypothetical protein
MVLSFSQGKKQAYPSVIEHRRIGICNVWTACSRAAFFSQRDTDDPSTHDARI